MATLQSFAKPVIHKCRLYPRDKVNTTLSNFNAKILKPLAKQGSQTVMANIYSTPFHPVLIYLKPLTDNTEEEYTLIDIH